MEFLTIIIYGIGEVGKLLIESMRGEYKLEAIIDENYDGCTYKEIPVFTISEVKNMQLNAYVVITPFGDPETIRKQLIEVGFIKERLIKMDEIFPEGHGSV